jgi:filamentous hemagglutinin family protein
MNDTSCRTTRQLRRAQERERVKALHHAQRHARHAGASGHLLLPLIALLFAPGAGALPVGGQVVNGSVTLGAPVNGAMAITQGTPQAIVNWRGFSIGGNESVNIQQPSASAVMLNRVVGTDASVIAGHLSANGKIFLVNPAGVLFSAGATVNVGSIVASALGIADKDFLAGNYHFLAAAGQPPGAVINQGSIQAGSGGTVALLGAHVDNSGTVAAKLGTVALGAGGDITLDFAGDGLTMLRIGGAAAQALASNSGTLAADGGQVLMSAQSADALAGTVINQSGTVRAQSIAQRNGRIVLDGGTNGVTEVAGLVDATGGAGLTGGHIDITGQYAALLDGARVDASGPAGGGRVRFGGGPGGADTDIRNAQAVWISPAAQVHADALTNGPGGQLVAYGTDSARLYGTMSAKGGPLGGNGGTIETSAQYLDTAALKVDASAPNGAGGMWILDPFDVTIISSSTTDVIVSPTLTFEPSATSSQIANGVINAQLNAGTSVVINTVPTAAQPTVIPPVGQAGDITISAPISKTAGGPSTLTLSAAGSIRDNGFSITAGPAPAPPAILTVTTPAGLNDGNTFGGAPTGNDGSGTITVLAQPGPLNIVMQANVGNSVRDGSAVISFAGSAGSSIDRVNLYSNGGNITIGSLSPSPAQLGASVALTNVDVDARLRLLPALPSTTAPSGSITIAGGTLAPGTGVSTGVDLTNTFVSTTNGAITISGAAATGTGTFGDGVVFAGTSPTAVGAITSTSGAISLSGSGTTIEPGTGYGVVIGGNQAATPSVTTISTDSGRIDIRAVVTQFDNRGSGADVTPAGLNIQNASISGTGTGQTISLSGSANTPGGITPGFVLTNANIDAGPQGTIILRAANNFTGYTFGVFTGTKFGTMASTSGVATGGTVAIEPARVDPATFAITPVNNVAINVFSDAPGFSVDSAFFQALNPSISTVVIGSTTHTGAITVAAATPPVPQNLTLMNTGAGSQGITLPVGVSDAGKLLVLASAGPVTQAGPITAASLMLDGPGSFTLTNPLNAVSQLSLTGTGNVSYVNHGNFSIASLQSTAYDGNAAALFVLSAPTSTPVGNTSLTATNLAYYSLGNIDQFVPIVKSQGGDATLTLHAANDISLENSITSSSGKLNMVFDASNSIVATSVGTSSRDQVQFLTNGGDFTAGTLAGGPAGFDGASLSFLNVMLDTTAGAASGSVTLHGMNVTNDGPQFAVDINDSSITASTGSIELEAAVMDPAANLGSGVALRNAGTQNLPGNKPSAIAGGSGAVRIYGAGSGTAADGVALLDGSSIKTSGGGSIDIRGDSIGTPGQAAAAQSANYGVLLLNGSVAATQAGSTISITGSTTTADAGVAIGAVPLAPNAGLSAGPVTVSAGAHGLIALRSANDGAANSLLIRSGASSIVAPNGVVATASALVDPASFAITAQNAIPITLFGAAGMPGLNIDTTTFQAFAPTLQTLVLGSSTQTGRITVDATCATVGAPCTPGRPAFTTDLTLANPGAGSAGIDLPSGVSMPGKTLTLSSAGPVTDPGGIQAAGLVLNGPGTFTLDDAGNAVATLALVNAGNVVFSNPVGFSIGPLTSQSYDSGANRILAVDGNTSTLTGNLQASAQTGGIALNTGSLRAGGSIDLVMEQGEFANPVGGTLGAGNAWHIWEASWIGETRGGLNPGGTQPNFYGCTFAGGCSWGGVVPLAANHFVYVARPSATVTADDKTRPAGTDNPPLTFTLAGPINGDTAGNAIAGSLSTTATAASPAGAYGIKGAFASPVGYTVSVVPGTLTVTSACVGSSCVNGGNGTGTGTGTGGGTGTGTGTGTGGGGTTVPANLQNQQAFDRTGLQPLFTAQEQSFVYESNMGGVNICVGSNQPILALQEATGGADSLAIEWKRVRARPNLNNCLVVNGEHGCGEF